jgi:hypothetical protein
VSFSRYAAVVGGVVGGALALCLGLPSLDGAAREASALGVLLAGLNSLAAYGLALWASTRSTVAFMRAVLGGMIARLALVLGAVVVAVLVFDLPRVPLAVSLLGSFAVLLGFELSVLHRTTGRAVAAR